jgi:hypothetical protein
MFAILVGMFIVALQFGFLSFQHFHIPTLHDFFNNSYRYHHIWIDTGYDLAMLCLIEVGIIYLFVKKILSRSIMLWSILAFIVLFIGAIYLNFSIAELYYNSAIGMKFG